MSQEEQESEFILACKSGDLDAVKSVIENDFDIEKYFINMESDSEISVVWFIVRNGDIEILKYLFDQNELFKEEKDELLAYACAYGMGNLNMVDYLMSEQANMYNNNGAAFNSACGANHLNIVQYFINKGYDIHYNNDAGFRAACMNNQLEIAQYLIDLGVDATKSPKITVDAFRAVKTNILNYLIFDLDIPFNEELKGIVKEFLDKEEKKEFCKIFELRELNKKLNNELLTDKINNKTIKL